MTISYDDFAKLQLKVARVLEARSHPNADKLVLLTVDLGEDEPRQIVAGIRKHYTDEQLVGRSIIVVANLEPVTLRGEQSNGMLLAASDEDRVILLTVDSPAAAGSSIK
jgi:methionyl-tRNA synthetase